MMRTLIELPDEMMRSLDEVSARRKASRASVVREAVGEYLLRHKLPDLDRAFGLWGKGASDGLAFQRKMRREW